MKIFGITVLISIALLVVAILVLQPRMLFFPTQLQANHLFQFDVPFEERRISYGNDETLHGLLFKPNKPQCRILYFHGNGGALDSWGNIGVELSKRLNCEVLIMDYPGYGKSTGGLPSSEKPLYDSASAAFKEFNVNSDPHLPLILYGRSLGTGVASYLATLGGANALVLETPYVSIKAMASIVLPIVPSFLVRYDLDNQKNLQNLKIPVLLIHGTADSVIPYTQSLLLAQEYPQVRLISVEGGDHNDLSQFPQFWTSLEEFVNSIGLSQ